MLSFDLENSQNIIDAFNSQKNIKGWYGEETIKEYNLLERAGKCFAILDNLINFINHSNEKKVISNHIHLESLRLTMYDDIFKSKLNEISHLAKVRYQKLSKKISSIKKIYMSNMNLSTNETVVLLAKVADIMNSYYEAKVENNLGNNMPEIVDVLKYSFERLHNLREDFKNNEHVDTIIINANMLMNANANNTYKFMINQATRLGRVSRWGKRKTLNNFNVLEHSARVACLVDVFLKVGNGIIAKEQELNTLRYAFYHDYPEKILNDLPSPVKDEFPDLNMLLKSIEKDIMKPLNLTNSKQAKAICKFADIYDCKFESSQEILLGNQDQEFLGNINDYDATFQKMEKRFEDVNPEIISLARTLFFK